LIASHLHWSYEAIMLMDHQERRVWVQEIARMIAGSDVRERRLADDD
jgi:hypothetical protein